MNKLKSFYGKRNYFYIKLLVFLDIFYLMSNYCIVIYYKKFLDSINIYIYLGALFFVF